MPRQTNIFIQEVTYETLLAYCLNCCLQGHNSKTCKRKSHKVSEKNLNLDGVKKDHKWVRKEHKKILEDKENYSNTRVVIFQKSEISQLENELLNSAEKT